MKMGQISEIALFIPKFGTLDPVTKVTSADVTMMTSKCYVIHDVTGQ